MSGMAAARDRESNSYKKVIARKAIRIAAGVLWGYAAECGYRKGPVTMAKPGTSENPSAVGYDDTQFEWENVHEEAPDQIIFTVIGDTYTGLYQGSEVITFDDKGEEKSFTQLKFRDTDGLKVINAGYELGEAFAKITAGSMT